MQLNAIILYFLSTVHCCLGLSRSNAFIGYSEKAGASSRALVQLQLDHGWTESVEMGTPCATGGTHLQ